MDRLEDQAQQAIETFGAAMQPRIDGVRRASEDLGQQLTGEAKRMAEAFAPLGEQILGTGGDR